MSRHLSILAALLPLLSFCPVSAPAVSRQATGDQQAVTSKRGRISLDGPWRFQPAGGGPPAAAAWGSLAVPGSWYGSGPGLETSIAAGEGAVWRGFDAAQTSRAWYERTVTVPADWAGRAILLDVARVSTDALVFVDGKSVGSVRWPSGEVDVTSAVRPGRSAQIRLLVIAAADPTEAEAGLVEAALRSPESDRSLKTRGLIGSVSLESRPQRIYVSDVAIEPSTRKKQLGLSLEVTGRLEAGAVDVTARLLDETGKEERQFTGQATSVSADRQRLNYEFSWPNPRLWDLNKPNLYTLVLSVRAPGLNDELRATFGFREFWIQGRQFFLNGIPIRLRPDTSQDIEAQRQAGFNFTEVWPEDPEERGSPDPDADWFDKADHAGWLTTGRLASLVPYVVDKDYHVIWNDARREAWTTRVERALHRYRNHPSIVMWGHSPNFFGNPQDQNPRVIGRVDRATRAAPTGAYQAGLEGCAIVRRLDPTRPVYTHQGADVGDVYAVNHYLDLIPLQEREDWMTDWASKGDMPYMGIEFGTPLYTSFLRGRMEYPRAVTSEPLLTEFASIYLGHQAYVDETPDYRSSYINRFVRDQTYKFDWGRDREPILDSPAFQKVEALFNRNTWRSWRTVGVTGGMVPWERHGWKGKELTESGRALVENNSPTLSWIVGPWDAPTAKTHSYHVDETVEKQVALINDTRETQRFRYSWRALIGGKLLSAGGGKGWIKPAQTVFHPLRFATPFFRSGKADGVIHLTAVIGTQTHTDSFNYRVFARRSRRDRPPSLPVFDPGGRTGDILPVADYIPRTWKGERSVPLVIVGQNALASGRPVPGNLEAYVRGGGRLLIFAQKPEWIEKTLGMRTAAYQSRRVFPVTEAHPLMRGIDALDLRDWRGLSSFLPGKPVYTGAVPETGWHWGNRGVVSSVSIEKPHMSSWRPLLEDEFDLAYTPLMEMDYGRGRAIWCSLDVEDHAPTDAAAERVFGRVLDYALHAPLEPKAERVVYVGGRSGAGLLTELGLNYRDSGQPKADAATLAATDSPQLLIVGEDGVVDPADLSAFLHRGGRVFFLQRRQSGSGVAPTLAVKSLHGSLDVPSWPECSGLSVSDLHWRADIQVPAVQSLPELDANGLHGVSALGADGLLGRIKLGRGVALFCQVAPDRIDADTKTYLRLTRWRQTRTLCQLLSNMGASFKQDGRIFQRSASEPATPGFYHPDYRTDFELGDNPYRYYRW